MHQPLSKKNKHNKTNKFAYSGGHFIYYLFYVLRCWENRQFKFRVDYFWFCLFVDFFIDKGASNKHFMFLLNLFSKTVSFIC